MDEVLFFSDLFYLYLKIFLFVFTICILTEPVVQAMMTYWSDTQTQIQVQMICVDRFRSDGSVSNLLGDLYHSVPHLNVILMVRFSVVSGIIKEVNDIKLIF